MKKSLEQQYKEETGLDAYMPNNMRPHIPEDLYVEWLEDKIESSTNKDSYHHRVGITKKEDPNGLHKKYIIERTDGKPIEPENEYFILKVKGHGDQKHIESCKKALAVYAEEVKGFLPELSKDLIERYSLSTKEPELLDCYLSVPFCNECDPVQSGRTYAPTANGKYKCSQCGNIYEIPTKEPDKEEEKEWEKLGFPDDNRRTEKALKDDLLHCYHCNETFTDVVKILEHYAKKHNGTPPKQ